MVFYFQVVLQILSSLMLVAQPDETEEDRTDIAGLKATKKSQRSIAAMNLKAKKKTPGKQITEK